MKLFREIRSFFRKETIDAEMNEELKHHIELQTALNLKAGLNPDEARYAALRQFGNVASIQERAREVRGLIWLEQVGQDLGYAVRGLMKSRGFTTVAVLTLALGIGANTAIFSVVDSVLLKPLAYREPQRLVTLLHEGKFPVSPADFLDWRKQSKSFETMAASAIWSATLVGTDRAEAIPGIRFGEGMAGVLGVAPLVGRAFEPDDFKPGAERVLVLGYGLWQRRFGGDAGVIGQSVTLSGVAYTVIGVMPAQFLFAPFWATRAEMAAPLDLTSRATSRDSNSLRVFARLKPDVSRQQAQTEMNAICRQLEQAYPQTNTHRTVQIDSLLDKTVGNIRGSLRLLLGAVVFVLLIGCVNVANLQLARSSARQKEMAVRVALGASRFRIARQLLTESVVLAGAGGALGLVTGCFAVGAIKILLAGDVVLLRDRMPRVDDISLNSTVLLFTLAITALTGLLAGILPALLTAQSAGHDALREDGRGATSGRRGRRMRNSLVVAEIALALIILTGAGLLLRSFGRLSTIDPGFDARDVLSMTVSLQGQPDMVGEKRDAFYRTTLEKIDAIPGVISSSAINHLPLASDLWTVALRLEDRPLPQPGERIGAVYRVVRPGYFQTMGIARLLGRDFNLQDASTTPSVVIINEQLARKYWPGVDPVGQRIAADDLEKNPKWLTIVGVIKNVRQRDWMQEADCEIYLPFAQSPFASDPAGHYATMTLVARTAVDPSTLVSAMQNAIRSVNGGAPISNSATLEQIIDATLWQPRFNLMLIALFAGVALLLASIGLYGVVAYAVVQRTREIGIRLALGAQRRDVLALVLGQGLKLVGIGLLLGLIGAFGLTRLLSSLLYQVKPTDPATFVTVSLLLLVVAILASWIPARRAARVDPMVALRTE